MATASTEIGIDETLLSLCHRQERLGQLRTIGRSAMTQRHERFAGVWRHAQTGQQPQAARQRITDQERPLSAKQLEPQGDRAEGRGDRNHPHPAQLFPEKSLQPGCLGGLIKTEPPAAPGQIQPPPLPLQPAPPGHRTPRYSGDAITTL